MLRGGGEVVKLFVVRMRVCVRGGVKPVENVPKKICGPLDGSGKALRDRRGVHPESAFGFFPAVAAAFGLWGKLGDNGLCHGAECGLDRINGKQAGLGRGLLRGRFLFVRCACGFIGEDGARPLRYPRPPRSCCSMIARTSFSRSRFFSCGVLYPCEFCASRR